jgi:hypothetical protein
VYEACLVVQLSKSWCPRPHQSMCSIRKSSRIRRLELVDARQQSIKRGMGSAPSNSAAVTFIPGPSHPDFRKVMWPIAARVWPAAYDA